jgi:hypothetical protein
MISNSMAPIVFSDHESVFPKFILGTQRPNFYQNRVLFCDVSYGNVHYHLGCVTRHCIPPLRDQEIRDDRAPNLLPLDGARWL